MSPATHGIGVRGGQDKLGARLREDLAKQEADVAQSWPPRLLRCIVLERTRRGTGKWNGS